ncbi:MAG: ribbon-helix-helix protein, CopG family [Ruminococcus sp.]|jgi:metal-responsive CopG/Arc/MetJ family transcriptional regulator|nr:ribbon-helix-helix protein, CopG family [Ruminococcus sp.]
MDKTTLAKLDAICKEQGVTRSQVIRNWIVEQYQGKK